MSRIRATIVMIGSENEQIIPRSSDPSSSSPLRAFFSEVTRCIWLRSSRDSVTPTLRGNLRSPASVVSSGIAMCTCRAGASRSKNDAMANGSVGSLSSSRWSGRHRGRR